MFCSFFTLYACNTGTFIYELYHRIAIIKTNYCAINARSLKASSARSEGKFTLGHPALSYFKIYIYIKHNGYVGGYNLTHILQNDKH